MGSLLNRLMALSRPSLLNVATEVRVHHTGKGKIAGRRISVCHGLSLCRGQKLAMASSFFPI